MKMKSLRVKNFEALLRNMKKIQRICPGKTNFKQIQKTREKKKFLIVKKTEKLQKREKEKDGKHF